MNDLYKVLGVNRNADQADIKKAYKKLARKHHPDVAKSETDAQRFKEISAAYAVLGDEEKRSLYDEFGEVSLQPGFDANQARAYKGFGGGMPGGGANINIDDLLGSLFGANAGRRQQRRRRSTGQKGPDIETTLRLNLVDALRGSNPTVTVRRPTSCTACQGAGGTGQQTCSSCQGSGQVSMRQFGFMDTIVACDDCGGTGTTFQSECPECAGTGRAMETQSLKVKVPAGIEDGQTIRLRGKGGGGVNGGPAGDLLMRVAVQPHPWLSREGNNLTAEIPITFAESLNGGTITVPTLEGEVRLKIPAGAKNGQRLRLRGKGVPGPSPGDMYVVLRPTPPDRPDEALGEQLGALYTANVRQDFEL